MRIPRGVGMFVEGMRGVAIFNAIGVIPGQGPVAMPEPFLTGPGGRFSYCRNPSGYGPVFSSWLGYFPGQLKVNPNACIGLQALPGGNDGFPDPWQPGERDKGMYRYTNLDKTRYTHLWSVRDGTMAFRYPEVLPSYRQSSVNVPMPPPPRPPEKAKEKKFIFRGGLRSAVDLLSEVGDVVDCLFKGLSPAQRRNYYSSYGGRLGKGAKALAAYENFHELDWGQVGSCLALNHVEDIAWGSLGRFTRKANQLRGNLAGVEVGPAL